MIATLDQFNIRGEIRPGRVGVWVQRPEKPRQPNGTPAEDKIAERLQQAGVFGSKAASFARRVVAAETGALLGVMARRVLGQYELVLPTDDDKGDVIFLVGTNVLAMERAHQFTPREFRLWLMLHECAHRAQFTGVPWMQEYFLSLVQGLVEAAEPEQGRIRRIAEEIRTAMSALDLAETGGSVRVSAAHYNTPSELDRLGDALEELASA